MKKPVVLMDTKYHDEVGTLLTDYVLNQLADEVIANGDNIDDVPMSAVNNEYKKRGGVNEPLTIGSLWRAMEQIIRGRFCPDCKRPFNKIERDKKYKYCINCGGDPFNAVEEAKINIIKKGRGF